MKYSGYEVRSPRTDFYCNCYTLCFSYDSCGFPSQPMALVDIFEKQGLTWDHMLQNSLFGPVTFQPPSLIDRSNMWYLVQYLVQSVALQQLCVSCLRFQELWRGIAGQTSPKSTLLHSEDIFWNKALFQKPSKSQAWSSTWVPQSWSTCVSSYPVLYHTQPQGQAILMD